MAIFGTINTLKQQTQGERLQKALDFLQNTDLAAIFEKVTLEQKQKVEIEGKDLFAMFQAYETKPDENVKMEAHRHYLDVQYIFEGSERILLASQTDVMEGGEYNAEKDVILPKVLAYSHLVLRTGEAVVLFPPDIHGPGAQTTALGLVKKVVVKVLI
jgi:biofilm protein TabA